MPPRARQPPRSDNTAIRACFSAVVPSSRPAPPTLSAVLLCSASGEPGHGLGPLRRRRTAGTVVAAAAPWLALRMTVCSSTWLGRTTPPLRSGGPRPGPSGPSGPSERFGHRRIHSRVTGRRCLPYDLLSLTFTCVLTGNPTQAWIGERSLLEAEGGTKCAASAIAERVQVGGRRAKGGDNRSKAGWLKHTEGTTWPQISARQGASRRRNEETKED